MPKVSIITPVYNSAKYLNQCVDSIICQSLKDIELILVDDGSTDSSPDICNEYARKDSRVKVIHNKNSGMGVSYNNGIDLAKGEYIGFVESDDFIFPNMYEKLYSLAKLFNPQIVKSSWNRYYTSNNTLQKDTSLDIFPENRVLDVKEYSDLLCVQFSVWSAIYKTDFLKNNQIRFPETPGASYQDVGFTFKAFCNCSSMVITHDAFLNYRQDNENSSINSKEKSEVIFDEYKGVDRFLELNPDIKRWANTRKLIKQYYDYQWNYKRIAPHLKHNFIKKFASDFKKYKDNNELDNIFYSNINNEFINNITNLI